MVNSRTLFDSEPEPEPPPRGRLLLLDGMALIYRAHFALIRSPRFTARGKNTSAIFGFCNTLLDVLKREPPTHIVVAFDTSEPTHRHLEFPAYKAQREEIPEDLAAQIPDVIRLLQAMHIPVLALPGWEADDVLGTLAKRAEAAGFDAFLVTPDKDYHQLVSPHIRIWKPGRQGGQFELLGVDEVCDRWQVKDVSQVIEILGLMGDASDNVPGIPGIGEKTAQKLIAEFGSIENLLAHTEQLTGKRRDLVETHADQARISRKLVTITTDVPLDLDWNRFQYRAADPQALRELFAEWEFTTLAKRLLGEAAATPSSIGRDENSAQPALAAETVTEDAVPPSQGGLFPETESWRSLQDVPHVYKLADTPAERAELIAQLMEQQTVCIDLETTGLDPRAARPIGMAICFQPGLAYYVSLPAAEADLAAVLQEFAPVLASPTIQWVGHNLKYDLSVLRWQGVRCSGSFVDTMLLHTLIEPEQKHGMDFLAREYLNYSPIPIRDLIGDPPVRGMQDVPLADLVEYACEDADVTLQLWECLRPEIAKLQMEGVFYEIECPLTPVLVEMEYEGIRLDVAAIERFSLQLQLEIEQLQQQIVASAGHEFNLDSPKQLGVVLFEELRLDPNPKKTATGQYSTREADLLRLASSHPIVRDVLEYRNAVKLKSVYVDQLPQAVDPRTGRVHTTYGQAWTATGRMQSNNPNLQTIPVRKERGREIRAAFVPRSEHYQLLSADYSQVELRIMAAMSSDPAMMEAFREGTDIHAVTAAKVYKVPLDAVTRAMRDTAKTVNFGIIYGISAFGLQQRLNIPRDEASSLIHNYFQEYPAVREYIDRTIAFAREHGYVATLSGRRRYLRDINSRNGTLRSTAERLAMNSPIQGTAADLLKLAMIRVHELLCSGGYRTRMLLTVHDELVFDLHRDEAEELVPRIREAMQNALPLDVPLVVEMGVGDNWLQAH